MIAAMLVLSLGASACDKAEADGSGDPEGEAASAVVSADEAGAPRASVSLPIVAEVATEGDLILSVNTKGAVYGDVVVDLSSDVGGTVAEVLVKPGARVLKGQPLVRFDPYPFDLAVRAAQATLDEREQAFRESFAPESLVTGIGPTPDQRKALRIRSGAASAEVSLEKAKWERERAEIRSPVTGYVDRLDLAVGERIGAGSPIATVVDLGALRIEAQVLEHDLPLIRVGGEAMVTSAAIPGRQMRGRIDAVLPIVDSITRIGRVFVRVPGETALRPGMYADVQLEAQRLPDRIMVPAKAVIERDGRPLVFVVRDGRAQWTYIQPGRSNGVDTEVLPDSTTGQIPVEPGDQIIVDGHLTLTHDAAVTVALRERETVTSRRLPAGARPNDN
jgi:RND family efflux transporter MFP subunit